MNGVLTVTRRELSSYFNSPLAYLFAVAFLLGSGAVFFFVEGFFAAGQASLRGYFALMPVLLSILVPALTMRLWAEERRQGTYELLLTMPFGEWDLALGKYLAAMAVVLGTLALGLPVPLFAQAFGRFDPGEIAGEYLGAALMASATVAIGQAISGGAKNQMAAFMASAMALLALSLAPQLTVWLELPSWLAGAVHWVSMSYHFRSFSSGVIDTRDLSYFVIVTGFCLYANARTVAERKWG